jgi:hypothetical protein
MLQAGRPLRIFSDRSPGFIPQSPGRRWRPIFAASTFDTDYILVKEEHAAAALKTLQDAGHELVPD